MRDSISKATLNDNNVKNSNKVTINQSLQNFKFYLYRNGRSESTAENYITDTNQFYRFIKKDLNNRIRYIHNIDIYVIELYKKKLCKNLHEGIYKSATVARKYNSVKVFCQFLESEYNIINVTKGDKFGNKGYLRDWNNEYEVQELPKIISDNEINILVTTMYASNEKNIFRDIAIIEILIATGCRRSELLEMKWKDIDFFKKEITIRRKKTRNTSVISVPKHVIEALTKVKKINGSLYVSEYIFKGNRRNSKKLSKSAFSNIIKKWVINANINPEISAHYFRHSFITTCLKENIPSEIIIKYTGHANVNALKPYTHLISQDTLEVSNLFERKRA